MSQPAALRSRQEEQNGSVWWSSDDYPFDAESILAYVPHESGVYGLYNSRYSLFIGESTDLRQALLRHCHNTDLLVGDYRPTGFMFEFCPAQTREQRARELIGKYRPIFQTELSSNNSWSFASDRETLALSAGLENRFEFPHEPVPKETREATLKFSGALERGVVLAAVLALAVSTIVYTRVFNDGTNQRVASEVGDRSESLTSKESAPANLSAGAQVVETQAMRSAGRNALQSESTKTLLRKEVREEASPTARSAAHAVSRSSPGTQGALGETSGAKGRINWTVQVIASAAMKTVEREVASLKSRGYEAYMVETQRDGQIWYRLRVGRFAKREEADALRGVLESREGYRGAYITTE